MARQDLLLFGGICTAIGLALLPIYIYPKMTSGSYSKIQLFLDLQPSHMRWQMNDRMFYMFAILA